MIELNIGLMMVVELYLARDMHSDMRGPPGI